MPVRNAQVYLVQSFTFFLNSLLIAEWIGIPMGLGAGFKLKESKEKERDKENIKKDDKPERHKSKKHKSDEEDDADVHSGWTSILEDWFCNGSGISINMTDPPSGSGHYQTRHMSTGNIPHRVSWKGPYQPLIKERMMGLYLTVFIHRDMRGLVRGRSCQLNALASSSE